MFKIGDIVVMQNCLIHPELNGEEAVIIEGLGARLSLATGETYLCYSVEIRTGEQFGPRMHQLRKKEPPISDLAIMVSAALFDRLKSKQPA